MEEIANILEGLKLPQILSGLIAFAIGMIISQLILRAIKKVLPRTKGWLPVTLHGSVLGLLKILAYTVTGLITASTMGIPITSLVALISVVGLAISLAVQGVLNNVAGGLIILSSHPFSVGDFISNDNAEGTVQTVYLTHTRLKTLDGRTVIIPNSTLHTSTLTNNTVGGMRRVDITVGASYDNTPDEVRKTILEMLGSIENIEKDPAPAVALTAFNDSDIGYTVRIWTKPEHYYEVRDAIHEAIYYAFRRSGIEMSYPHINVHMSGT